MKNSTKQTLRILWAMAGFWITTLAVAFLAVLGLLFWCATR